MCIDFLRGLQEVGYGTNYGMGLCTLPRGLLHIVVQQMDFAGAPATTSGYLSQVHRPIQEFDEQANARLTGVSKRLFSQAAQITEVERALRESHDRLLSIVETANDPIIGADSFGNV